ncbi:MAG: hypothetical protein HY819_18185 [Acidobacteria bacterium]|nr:hypothetical protein [Acidobacteriota bacterium]
MASINNNFSSAAQNFDQVNSLAKDALSLATAINGGDLKSTLDSAGKLFQNLGNLNDIIGGSAGNTNTTQGAPMSSKLSSLDMMKLFGLDTQTQEENKTKSAAAAAAKGKVTGLAGLLALVSMTLANAMQGTADKIAELSKKLDAQKKGEDGVSFEDQAMLQRLTFDLQQFQTLSNRVVETVTGLEKSAGDAQRAVTQNLAV